MKVEKNGKKVKIELELHDPRPSNSGKSNVIFTTGGFTLIPGTDLKINLTIIAPK